MIIAISFLAECTASFIEIFILCDLVQVLFSNDKGLRKSKANWLVMLIALLLVQIMNSISIVSPVTPVIMILFWCISSKIMFSVDYVTALSVSGFYMITIVAFDFFFFSSVGALFGGHDTFMSLIGTPGPSRIAPVLIDKLIYAVFYSIVRKNLVKFHFNMDSRNFFIKITVAGCISCLILAKLTFDSFPFAINQLWFLVLCVFVCFVFFHSYTVNKKMNEARLEMMDIRNQMLEESYDTLNGIYDSNSRLFHDLNNHMEVLYQLLDGGKVADAKMYIDKISEPIKDLRKIVWTGVDAVDVVLNSKLERAKRENINVIYNVEFPSNTNIQAHDICVILSNLIDNAIEATAKGNEGKEIKVTIRKINKFLCIQISNPIFESLKIHDGHLKTTKYDSSTHGWGLQSVKAAAENYEGTVKFTFDDNVFTVTVMLFYA